MKYKFNLYNKAQGVYDFAEWGLRRKFEQRNINSRLATFFDRRLSIAKAMKGFKVTETITKQVGTRKVETVVPEILSLPESKMFEVFSVSGKGGKPSTITGSRNIVEVFQKPKASNMNFNVEPSSSPSTKGGNILDMYNKKSAFAVSDMTIKNIAKETFKGGESSMGIIPKTGDIFLKSGLVGVSGIKQKQGSSNLFTGTNMMFGQGASVFDITGISDRGGQITTPIDITGQSTGQKQGMFSINTGQQSSTNFIPDTIIPIPTGWGGGFSLLPSGGSQRGSRSSGGMESVFNPKYIPSVEALVFNIRGAKPSSASISTGLNIRPIISGKRRK